MFWLLRCLKEININKNTVKKNKHRIYTIKYRVIILLSNNKLNLLHFFLSFNTFVVICVLIFTENQKNKNYKIFYIT